MTIKIETRVAFEFNGQSVLLDAYKLERFYVNLYAEKGYDATDESGQPVLGDDGKPRRLLKWEVIVSETRAYVKAEAGIDISEHHARGVYFKAPTALELAEKNLRAGSAETSPTSPPSTDPRYSD